MVKDVGFHRQPGCWLRSSHTLKECVTAHWSRKPAPKINGAKTRHRSIGFVYEGMQVVEEQSARTKPKLKGMVDEAEERMPE